MLLNGVISFQVSLVKCLMLLAIASVHLVLSTVEWNACEQEEICSFAPEQMHPALKWILLSNGLFVGAFIWAMLTEEILDSMVD